MPNSGKYEIRLFWAGHENRASNALCVIERPSRSPETLRINQKQTPEKGSKSLGVFELNAGTTNAVVLQASDVDGNVVADAIQIIAAP
jgi:hypothetical protein